MTPVMRRPARRYTPRRPSAPSVDVDTLVATRRARQLELRLRLCVPRDGDLWPKIQKATDAAKRLEPADRISALLDLADDIRPVLPEAVVTHTLPATINRWRPQ